LNVADLICKKRNKGILSREEIQFLIKGYVAGEIPDYQIAALLMAIWFVGMHNTETTDLTLAMADSGERVDLSSIPGVKVDKHSTGGVGDATTLIVAPLVAACGGKVAKMSGRGLGHTGGTLDKLESIPGLSVQQSIDSFIRIVADCGLAIVGQTADLAPADRLLYALRDVTGTIDSIPLIAASIMSKKLVSGSDAIVLDVKTGNGAFMNDMDGSEKLAKTMTAIGAKAGKRTTALITDMNQPLGNAVGNALEVREAIQVLRGELSGDLKTVSLALATQMLLVSGICADEAEARQRVESALSSGEALNRLARMIRAQGGHPEVIEKTELMPRASRQIPVLAGKSGRITRLDTARIGYCALLLGAGRQKKGDSIDPAVGLWMQKRLGDEVTKGEALAVLHVNAEDHIEEAFECFQKAVNIDAGRLEARKLIYKTISG
jgi:pyrimidine-nucleoside phosphorylase